MREMNIAPSSRSTWSSWESARTSVARRRTGSKRVRSRSRATGREGSTAPATGRCSTLPAGSTRTSPPRTISGCRPTPICRRARSSSAKTRKEPRTMAAAEKQPVTITGAGPLNGAMSGLLTWIDQRFPLMENWRSHLAEYYAPKNFNFWYYFGSLALFVLVIQIVTGIFLTMNYKPDAAQAFASVEYIMREVPWGWWIRYMHSTGASFFFICVYLHMFRGLLYGSYRKPRELLWIFGMLI